MAEKNISTILRKIPLEAYILIIAPCFGLLAAWLLYRSSFSIRALLFYFFYADNFFPLLIILLYVYFIIKIAVVFFAFVTAKADRQKFFKEFIDLAWNQLYFNALLFFAGLFMGSLLEQLPKIVGSEKIQWSSVLLLNYDYLIFGSDLLFSLSRLVNATSPQALSWLLIFSYNAMALLIMLLAFALFFFSKLLVKKFLIFFFLLTVLSIPIWYFFPTLNPLGFYIAEKLNLQAPERIVAQLEAYQPAPRLFQYQEEFSAKYRSTDFLDITAFPSMHAGYSIIVIIFAYILWRPSLFFTVPWFLLEMAGALYLGQHYAVDLLLGVIMAFAVYGLVEWLFALEKRYYKGKGSLFIIDTMQADMKRIYDFYREAFKTAGLQTMHHFLPWKSKK